MTGYAKKSPSKFPTGINSIKVRSADGLVFHKHICLLEDLWEAKTKELRLIQDSLSVHGHAVWYMVKSGEVLSVFCH